MQSMLMLGCGVIGVFALIFLFYTNSFLIRRRKKEFGLYNILGMGKESGPGAALGEYYHCGDFSGRRPVGRDNTI